MFDIPPDPVAFQLGPLTIGWYGLCYAIGLALAYLLLVRLARLAGEDPDVVGNGIIIVAFAALIGGRLYHVVDQWQLYANDPLKIILPPYSGLGVYGGIASGTLAGWWYTRRRGVSFVRWADIVAPALFVMQAVGRWGNYFNQELYGPPTTLPWGIPIDAAHRVPPWDNLAAYPVDATRFHPLFAYEALLNLLGMVVLLLVIRRFGQRLFAGDVALLYIMWYGAVRSGLETFRTDNWLIAGVPTAIWLGMIAFVLSAAWLVIRHRRGWGSPLIRPPTSDADDAEPDAAREAQPTTEASTG